MNERNGLAVVTGASSGIGYELALQLAHPGYDLIMNSADEERLEPAAAKIRRLTGRHVHAVRADLRHYEETKRLCEAITATARPVAIGVLNAGVGQGGAFLDTHLEDEFEIVDLNVRSTVHLAKRLLRTMAAQGDGRILITSSIASTMPGSFQAVYNASKSFLQSFAQALQNELQNSPSRSPPSCPARPKPTSSGAPTWRTPRSAPAARTIPPKSPNRDSRPCSPARTKSSPAP